jgi:beta-barrel assembly-enhancing protease
MIVTLIVCISPLNKNLQMSFSPLFQLLGEPVKSVSTAVGRILPIDDIDEVELGKEITKQFHFSDQIDTQESKYLTAVLKNITVYSKRKMNYQIFIMESEYPNAFALPGGTIVITRGLLGILDSESELISVLAHEMGHIEQSHCLNSVKYRIAANKVGMRDLGSIGDFASRLLVQHAYSKTQENEADEYAFKLISQTQYDPNGVYLAFKRLNDSYKEQRTQKTAPTIIDDYFTSHPRIEHRLSKFKANGMQWWQLNPNENRYIGIKYLQEKSPFSISQFKNEWTNTKKKQE